MTRKDSLGVDFTLETTRTTETTRTRWIFENKPLLDTIRDPKPNPQSRKTTLHLHGFFFEKFVRTFPCFPVTRVRNPTGIVQKKLARMNFIFEVGVYRVAFPPVTPWAQKTLPINSLNIFRGEVSDYLTKINSHQVDSGNAMGNFHGNMEKNRKKTNHIKEFGGRKPRKRPRDKVWTSQGHLGRLGRFVEIQIQGAECPRERRETWWDRWDMSMGQTGHTPRGVPPTFFMFIGFFFPQLTLAPKPLDTHILEFGCRCQTQT